VSADTTTLETPAKRGVRSVPHNVLADVAGILGCACALAEDLESCDRSVDLRRALQCAHRMVSEALDDY
jgi:hypothetical protein